MSDRLDELFVIHGVPECIRSDNGPEFVAGVIQAWLSSMDVQAFYVVPVSLWQNGYAEISHTRLRELNMVLLDSVCHAGTSIAAWREDYSIQEQCPNLISPQDGSIDCASGWRSCIEADVAEG